MLRFQDKNKVTDPAFCVRIEQPVASKRELLDVLAQKMNFPEYFGHNWDALYDCLVDLHWIEEKNILIIHESVPKLNKEDLTVYLDILRDAADVWKSSDAHRLIVYFPDGCI